MEPAKLARKRREVPQVRPTMLDRAIAQVSPTWAAKRLQARLAMALYEAGGFGRRWRGYPGDDVGVNAKIEQGLRAIRARARHLAENNAYAEAAHREIPVNVVGNGIQPHVAKLEPDDRACVECLIDQWFDQPDCDAAGQVNFYGLQNQIMRAVVEDGECLVRRVIPRGRPPSHVDRHIPLQLQVLPPEYLDQQKSGKNGRNRIVQGVEISPTGRRVAYWMFPHDPGEQPGSAWESTRVPSSSVLHIFNVARAGQVRGVPWGAPVLLRLRDFDDYADAQLYRQKIAACFTAFVTPPDPGFGAPAQTDDNIPERMEPGMIEVLGNGKDVSFSNPPRVDGYADYSSVTLHEIATGYGVPYSVLTGDLRRVNFSSGRLGNLAFNKNVMHWQRQIMISQLCVPVWRWFMQACQAMGYIEEPVPVMWTPPKRELTDPSREIPAQRDAVRSGFLTHPEAIRQMGYDPDDLASEQAAWNRQADELGLVFDADPRKVTAAGLTQARSGSEPVLPPVRHEDNPQEDDQ